MKKHILFFNLSVLFFSIICWAEEPGIIEGIFSNVQVSSGELSGMEMFFIPDGRPGACSTSVLFQVFEGSPQYPELLDCCGCTGDGIEFTSKTFGSFKGEIDDNKLLGEFNDIKYEVELDRGISVWQQVNK